ncbi:acetyltransferase [Microbacterium sp. NPDC019599]|uniref:acetyltransferase n=1 Tax=Microbacterium sp. NPDC019599 TaxID=3154690 RepID=UPI0033FD1C8A
MTDEIIVVGAGGFGRETLDVVEAINSEVTPPPWTVLGVVDDAPSHAYIERLTRRGYVHLGGVRELLTSGDPSVFALGIGSPAIKRRIGAEFKDAGWKAATLVHPAAVVGSAAQLSPGTIICGGVQVSTNTTLGEHVHLNPGAIIGHDVEVGANVSINPGAIISGEVRIGESALVGAGAVVLQGLTIGARAVVGAGSVVTRDVEVGAVVKGVPAR